MATIKSSTKHPVYEVSRRVLGINNSIPSQDRSLIDRMGGWTHRAAQYESLIIASFPPGRDGLYYPHAEYVARVLERHCARILEYAIILSVEKDQARLKRLRRMYRVTLPTMQSIPVAVPYVNFIYSYYKRPWSSWVSAWIRRKAKSANRNNSFKNYIRLAHIPWTIINQMASANRWIVDIKKLHKQCLNDSGQGLERDYIHPTRLVAAQLAVALVAKLDSLIRQIRKGDFTSTDPSPYMNERDKPTGRLRMLIKRGFYDNRD